LDSDSTTALYNPKGSTSRRDCLQDREPTLAGLKDAETITDEEFP
jgi:hypothetical protein